MPGKSKRIDTGGGERYSWRRELPPGGGSRQAASMFSVNLREGIVILAILVALIFGAAVKHWRDGRRERPAPLTAPAP